MTLRWHGDESQARNILWLIKNLLPQVGVGLLSGQWGTFKSFMALLLAGCVMTGQTFVDYRIRRKGGVLFIVKEGQASLPLRLAVMNEKSLGRQDNEFLPFAYDDPPLSLLAQGSDSLIKLAREAQAEMRRRFDLDLVLIIIDTMGAAAGFHKEGEGSEGNFVMNELHKLAKATKSFVLAVDHFGKDVEAGTRGTMTKEDRSDTVLALIGKRALTGKIDDLRMGVRKVRDGDSGREIPFRTEVIDCGTDEDGDPVTSRIIHFELDRPARAAQPQQSRSDAIFLWALDTTQHTQGDRERFPGLVAALEAEVRTAFMRRYMNGGEGPNRDAAGQRWRAARDRAIGMRAVERREDLGVATFAAPSRRWIGFEGRKWRVGAVAFFTEVQRWPNPTPTWALRPHVGCVGSWARNERACLLGFVGVRWVLRQKRENGIIESGAVIFQATVTLLPHYLATSPPHYPVVLLGAGAG